MVMSPPYRKGIAGSRHGFQPAPLQQGRSAPFLSGYHRFRYAQCGVRFFATLRSLASGKLPASISW